MEQKLFIAACIMYLFSWISKRLFRKNKLDSGARFGLWHASFLLLFLGCVYSIFNFVMSSGADVLGPEKGLSLKECGIWLVIVLISVYGFFSAKKKQIEKRQQLIKIDLDWANTIYFAGFVASIVMFFFVQAFKIPSASMYNTLRIGDHLFVNKAAYGFRIPLTQIRFAEFNKIKPGDIIVFSFPAETKDQVNCGGYQYGRDYVKRVVAMPGDKVEVKNGSLFINDKQEPLHGYEIFEPVQRYEPVVAVREETSSVGDIPSVFPQEYQSLWESRKLEHVLGLSLRDNFGPVVVPEGHYFGLGDNRDNSCDSRFWGPIPRQNIKGTAWFIHWPLNRIQLIK